ncbi:MAG TPA: hypothetical protein VFG73_07350 [Rhodanobacteraceae bacterium]|nr:hypothetical protein [Rhodanobacteraceae bacterium]
MDSGAPKTRGWALPVLFFILGAIAFADYFFKPGHAYGDLARGVGFLLVVPHVRLNVGGIGAMRLARWQEIKARLRTPVYWLALVGAACLLGSMISEWL